MKRIVLVLAALIATVCLGSATVQAAPFVPAPAPAAAATHHPHPPAGYAMGARAAAAGGVATAGPIEKATAVATAAGAVVVKTLRACGLGALVGKTSADFSLQNVIVFVNAMGQRLAAVAAGPVAIITVAAYGCVERVLAGLGAESGGR